MYLTTKQFTKALLTTHQDHNEILKALEFLYTMRKRLGRKMETETYMHEIKKEYALAYSVWIACLGHRKKKTVQLKQLIRTSKELADDYKKQFIVHTGSDDVDTLIKKVSSAFDEAVVTTTQNDTAELAIQGEGYYYRRSIHKDVDKLLS